MNAARILKHARRRAGLTQRALAEKAGMPQPTVARIERGTTVPRVDTLDKLLEACGEGLYARPRLGVGVDRTTFDESLRKSPAERLRSMDRSAAELYALRTAFRASRGKAAEAPPASGATILAILADHEVRFIIIGGVAGNLHGSNAVTNDLDVCYARDRENLERVASALRELEAYPRGARGGLPLQLDAVTLRNGTNFTFDTRLGKLDCLGLPSGTDGYDDLARTAIAVEMQGHRILVCSLDDLIRMKEAADRPKDRWLIEELAALQEQIDSEEQGGPPTGERRLNGA